MNIDITTIASLTLVATAVSLLVQWLKKKFAGGSDTTIILVGLSIIAGTIYWFLRQHQNILQDIFGILVLANAVYNFVIQWFEKPAPTSFE